MQHHIRWRSRPNVAKLEQNIDRLRMDNIQLRHGLGNKLRHVEQVKTLLHQRTERIDELANTIAVLRDQNRRLNEEADHLAEMVRLPPGGPHFGNP
jgi:hypothetical protein